MKKNLAWFFASLACSLPLAAAPLHVVQVTAPAVNCLFSTNCITHGNDFVSPLNFPNTTGSGRLISRTFSGEPHTAASGNGVFIYCVDVSGIHSTTPGDGIMNLKVPFHDVRSLDFAGTGNSNSQAFVISHGGMGQVGPYTAVLTATNLTFNFNPPLHFASGTNAGQMTYFFGVVSSNVTRRVSAQLLVNQGPLLTPVGIPATGPGF